MDEGREAGCQGPHLWLPCQSVCVLVFSVQDFWHICLHHLRLSEKVRTSLWPQTQLCLLLVFCFFVFLFFLTKEFQSNEDQIRMVWVKALIFSLSLIHYCRTQPCIRQKACYLKLTNTCTQKENSASVIRKFLNYSSLSSCHFEAVFPSLPGHVGLAASQKQIPLNPHPPCPFGDLGTFWKHYHLIISKDQHPRAVPVPVSPGLSVYSASCDISSECLSRRVGRHAACFQETTHTHMISNLKPWRTKILVLRFAVSDMSPTQLFVGGMLLR